ncbi:MAG TPA: c-type cytochrome [Anaerolineaceae bacterium]|nr:c-type cytochrome [Anaerolineaceae bacterium]
MKLASDGVRKYSWWGVMVALLIPALLSACTPTPMPLIVDPQPSASPSQTAVASGPYLLPDATNGGQLYAHLCQDCHGQANESLGPQVVALDQPLRPFNHMSVARTSRPADWFDAITSGIPSGEMPSYGTSLTERQRWDLVAYLFMQNTDAASLALGETIYERRCETCHGTTGAGDGDKALKSGLTPPNWTIPANLSSYSAMELKESIAQGLAPSMPAFANRLSEYELRSVAGYVQSFLFGWPQSLSIVSVSPAATPMATLDIEGSVTNGSQNGLPADLEIALNAYQGSQNVYSAAQPLNDLLGGTYRFDNVPLHPDWIYQVSVIYSNYTFQSDPLSGNGIASSADVNLPLTIYETTTDRSALSAERLQVVVDYSRSGWVQVVQMYLLVNATNRLVVAEQPGDPVLWFDLPDQAENLQFADQITAGRFSILGADFGDYQAIPPGTNYQIVFAYDLPFKSGDVINIHPPVPVSMALIMLPKEVFSLESDQLEDAGERVVEGAQLQLYRAYDLPLSSDLSFSLRERSGMKIQSNSWINLLIGSLMLIIALLITIAWLRATRRPLAALEDPPQTPEAILDAIIALDDQARAGKISNSAYHQRRTTLRQQLRAADSAENESSINHD